MNVMKLRLTVEMFWVQKKSFPTVLITPILVEPKFPGWVSYLFNNMKDWGHILRHRLIRCTSCDKMVQCVNSYASWPLISFTTIWITDPTLSLGNILTDITSACWPKVLKIVYIVDCVTVSGLWFINPRPSQNPNLCQEIHCTWDYNTS